MRGGCQRVSYTSDNCRVGTLEERGDEAFAYASCCACYEVCGRGGGGGRHSCEEEEGVVCLGLDVVVVDVDDKVPT